MSYQFYWPNWWKLWPYYKEYPETDMYVTSWVFCLGPLQLRGYKR